MGLLNGPNPPIGLGTMNPPPGSMGPPPPLPPLSGGNFRSLVPQQMPGPGRHLQILDHTVHRIDAHTKANGEEEKEMVVSNLRHFNLKIGVYDKLYVDIQILRPIGLNLRQNIANIFLLISFCFRGSWYSIGF